MTIEEYHMTTGALILLTAASLSQPSARQPSIDGACCSIDASLVARVTNEHFEFDQFAGIVHITTSGAVLVVGDRGQSIGVFGARGQFVRRIGRRGGAPGEFGQIYAIERDFTDSLRVFDIELRRESVLDPDASRVIRVMPWVPTANALFLRGNRRISSGSIPTRESAGYPLHLFDSSGKRLRSFGASGRQFDLDNPFALMRPLSRARNGGVWIGDFGQYRVELVDSTWRTVLALERSERWFPPSRAPFKDPRVKRPYAMMRNVREDDRGYLWVGIARAKAGWRPTVPDTPGEREPPKFDEVEHSIETVLEVWEAKLKRVVASRTFPGSLVMSSDGDKAWRRVVRPDGSEEIQIFTLSIRGGPLSEQSTN